MTGTTKKVAYDTDSWGRITGTGFSDGVKGGYEYTYSGQISRTVNGNGNAIQYRYDSLGRLVRAVCDGHSYEYELWKNR